MKFFAGERVVPQISIGVLPVIDGQSGPEVALDIFDQHFRTPVVNRCRIHELPRGDREVDSREPIPDRRVPLRVHMLFVNRVDAVGLHVISEQIVPLTL